MMAAFTKESWKNEIIYYGDYTKDYIQHIIINKSLLRMHQHPHIHIHSYSSMILYLHPRLEQTQPSN